MDNQLPGQTPVPPPRRRRLRNAVIVGVVVGCGIAAAAVAPELGSHPRPACDTACRRLAGDEQAFYQSWKPKLAALSNCTNEKTCMAAADAVGDPLRAAIRARPDAQRYDSVEGRLDNLRQTQDAVNTCFKNPFATLAAACAGGELAVVRDFGQFLDSDLSLVVLHTEEAG